MPSPVPVPPVTAGSVPLDRTSLPPAVTHAASAHAPLLSWVLPAGLGFLTLLALAFFVRRLCRRPRGSIGVSSLAGVGCLLLAVLTAAGAVNVYAGYLPTVDSASRFVTGAGGVDLGRDATTTPGRWTLETVVIPDAALDIGSRKVLIATPPGYVAGSTSYPALYLFGGFPGRPQDWFVSGRITQTLDALHAVGRSPNYVLVAPDVNGGFFTDSETLDQFRGPQVETWVTRDVVGFVEAHYRVRTDRASRVVAGMSSGGFAVLNVILRHQTEFSVGLALEPYGDPGQVTKRLLGNDVTVLKANSPSAYAPTERLDRLVPMFLDVGSGGEVAQVRALAQILHDRSEPVLLRVEKGQRHTWTEATAGLPYALSFAARQLADPARLDGVYPVASFPVTGPDAYAGRLSQDGQAQEQRQVDCDRLLRDVAAGRTTRGHPDLVPSSCLIYDRRCPPLPVATLPTVVGESLITRLCTRPEPVIRRSHVRQP